MKLTDDLVAQEVLAGRDAARDVEGHLALVGDETVNAPGLVGRGQTVLVDLEPLQTGDRALSSIRNLRTAR